MNFLGNSSRDSAGDTLDPLWYEKDGKLLRVHWGTEIFTSPVAAIRELETEAKHAEAIADSSPELGYCRESALIARATIARIRQRFNLQEVAL